MSDPIKKPIVVSESAGLIDTMTALGRYALVIATSFPVILALLKTRDISGILDYVRGADGSVMIAAFVGIGTLCYGLFKTFTRGKQIATVADDSRVPNAVAKIG